MNEYSLYQSHMRKLADFCDEAGLDFVVSTASWPISMEVWPRRDYAQMSILPEQTIVRADSRLRFTLESDEIQHVVTNGFAISKRNLTKLDGFFDKISSAYLQYFFHALIIDEEAAPLVAPLVSVGDE